MKKTACRILIFLFIISPLPVFASHLLHDDFIGSSADPDIWHIPTYVGDGDGTYIGRTQFRCTPVPLPAIINGNAAIVVETYNPIEGVSFYGTDLISNILFSSPYGIHIAVRAKMDTSVKGIVGGIFLYTMKENSNTLHDEIDFELLTNLPSGVQTNIYKNEPLGEGHTQFVPYETGLITDYHTYEIKWYPGQVIWLLDGKQIRTDTSYVPERPMKFHLNIWVPDADWSIAYDPNLQPTPIIGSNKVYSMSVDYVDIKAFKPTITGPILPLLLK